jgi:hypothetical protein
MANRPSVHEIEIISIIKQNDFVPAIGYAELFDSRPRSSATGYEMNARQRNS